MPGANQARIYREKKATKTTSGKHHDEHKGTKVWFKDMPTTTKQTKEGEEGGGIWASRRGSDEKLLTWGGF